MSDANTNTWELFKDLKGSLYDLSENYESIEICSFSNLIIVGTSDPAVSGHLSSSYEGETGENSLKLSVLGDTLTLSSWFGRTQGHGYESPDMPLGTLINDAMEDIEKLGMDPKQYAMNINRRINMNIDFASAVQSQPRGNIAYELAVTLKNFHTIKTPS